MIKKTIVYIICTVFFYVTVVQSSVEEIAIAPSTPPHIIDVLDINSHTTGSVNISPPTEPTHHHRRAPRIQRLNGINEIEERGCGAVVLGCMCALLTGMVTIVFVVTSGTCPNNAVLC